MRRGSPPTARARVASGGNTRARRSGRAWWVAPLVAMTFGAIVVAGGCSSTPDPGCDDADYPTYVAAKDEYSAAIRMCRVDPELYSVTQSIWLKNTTEAVVLTITPPGEGPRALAPGAAAIVPLNSPVAIDTPASVQRESELHIDSSARTALSGKITKTTTVESFLRPGAR